MDQIPDSRSDAPDARVSCIECSVYESIFSIFYSPLYVFQSLRSKFVLCF